MKKIFFIFIQFFLVTTALANQLIIEPNAGRAPLLQAIANTQHSLDLVMYGLTDPDLLQAIIKQKQHGRTVKVILERAPYKSEAENTNARAALLANHIEVHDAIAGTQLIHQKTLIIDDQSAWVMTFNFTKSTFKNQRNMAVVVDDAKIVNDIVNVFNADWNQVAAPAHSSDLIYSPDDSRIQLATAINNAKRSLKVYAQSVNDYQTIGDLAKAAQRGVKIDIITSSQLREKQKQYLENAGVKIYHSNKLYIHAKVFIIDNRDAIIGSINLTKASIEKNRELAIVTHDKNIIQELNEIFNQDKNTANTPTSTHSKRFNQSQHDINQLSSLFRKMKKLFRPTHHRYHT